MFNATSKSALLHVYRTFMCTRTTRAADGGGGTGGWRHPYKGGGTP